MNVFYIAYKSLRQRWFASSLTAFSVALGIMLMVMVLVINGIVTDTFKQRGTGYSLIIGAKGSDLGMVMSCVYRIEVPEEPLPYRFYRDDILKNPRVKWAIPIAMGDYTEKGAFPIVGTTPRYFAMEYIPDHKFRIRGTIPSKPFEAVIGSRVARVNGWDLGSELKLTHGGAVDHVHDERFKVVGVLERTGTPDDKTVFVNIEGFFLISGHEKPAHEAIDRLRQFGYEVTPEEEAAIYKAAAEMSHEGEEPGTVHDHLHAVPDDLKEVSFILVHTKSTAQAIGLVAKINEGVRAKAVNPIFPMTRFLNQFVGNIRTVLVFLTGMITAVAGIGIFVSIYNSMAERKREIAIMRALGARRSTVFSIIIGESLLLCLGGGLVGLILGHGAIFIVAPFIEQEAGILVDPWKFATLELVIFPVLMVMGTIVGILPAFSAYRTDVAESLSD
jgi:putative ABC transport system permease protein